MRTSRVGVWGAAAAAVFLAWACGSLRPLGQPGLDAGALLGDADAADDAGALPDGGPSLDALCALLTGARCEALARCGLVSDAGLDGCRGALGRTWCGPATWPSHVLVGALRLDLPMALRCGAALGSASCGEVLAAPADCLGFLVPGAGLNQPCYDGYPECAQGVCRGVTCPKTCQAPGAAGGACSGDRQCEPGLYCRFAAATSGGGACTAPAALDAGCDPATRCAAPAACLDGRCLALPGPGQACLLGLCEAGAAWCADGGVCLARAGAGQACPADLACGPGLLCLDGACAPALVPGGAACSPAQQCAEAGQGCVGPADAGRCLPRLPAGPCQSDQACELALACQPASDGGRACAARLPASAPCLTTRQCQLDAECAGGQCTPRALPGQPCGLQVSCSEGLCLPAAADGGSRCGPLLGPSGKCTADAQCASGHCILGSCLTACTP